MKTFLNIAGGTIALVVEALLCLAGYFLLNATISVVSSGGLVAVVGGLILVPITAGVLIGGMTSTAIGFFKGFLTGRKWYILLLQFLIFCAFILVIVLNFVL